MNSSSLSNLNEIYWYLDRHQCWRILMTVSSLHGVLEHRLKSVRTPDRSMLQHRRRPLVSRDRVDLGGPARTERSVQHLFRRTRKMVTVTLPPGPAAIRTCCSFIFSITAWAGDRGIGYGYRSSPVVGRKLWMREAEDGDLLLHRWPGPLFVLI